MAPPVRVAGRVTGPEPIQAIQAGIRATQYLNPYVRAGWDNWKLALAEAEMWAKQDASEYDAKLKQYEVLYDLRKQLEGDLARLQLEAEKAGAEAAKVVFQEGQDAALANASATNSSGFSAVPGGYEADNGSGSFLLDRNGYWWSTTEFGSLRAVARILSYTNGGVSTLEFFKDNGFSVRCIKN